MDRVAEKRLLLLIIVHSLHSQKMNLWKKWKNNYRNRETMKKKND
ncbi:Uncharacterised protein [Mycobacteroides abscessus subsp. abscessus]|nr:Uncharacterised protein [Mycobacteroides abscessus subsp. abscessus]